MHLPSYLVRSSVTGWLRGRGERRDGCSVTSKAGEAFDRASGRYLPARPEMEGGGDHDAGAQHVRCKGQGRPGADGTDEVVPSTGQPLSPCAELSVLGPR